MAATKIDYTEKFLEEYKKFEQTLQSVYGSDMSVRAYEDVDTDESKRLQICRLLRNYAAHTPDIRSFFPISCETCDYMARMRKKVLAQAQTVKDAMVRFKPLTENDTLAYAARRLGACEAVPVVGGEGTVTGLFGDEILRKAVAGGMGAEEFLSSKKLPQLCPLDAAMVVAPNHILADVLSIDGKPCQTNVFVVTSDGSKKGKYLGLLIREKGVFAG